jgi:branched-chain amino acid transport system ATP-binding protein
MPSHSPPTACSPPPAAGPPRDTAAPLLEVRGLSRSFGGVSALRGVSFTVRTGQIKAVIGPNGAGKTTLFNAISGLLKPDGGEVSYRGESILGLRPYQIARRGISRSFQNLSLFPNMTVGENVMVGRHCRTRSGVFSAVLRTPQHRREERAVSAAATTMLDAVGLPGRAADRVASLSFGQRRLVELARALATEPALLLLDEPASGLNTKETEDLAQVIRRIRDQGVTVLLVEHDMSLVMEISDSILVLNYGEPIAEGNPAAVRNDPQVIAIYLGGEFGSAAD